MAPNTLSALKIENDDERTAFEAELSRQLTDQLPSQDPNSQWKYIKEKMLSSLNATKNVGGNAIRRRWISSASAALLDARTHIPPDATYDTLRKTLRRQLTKSLRNDREQWWIAKCQELEKAAAIGNSRRLFRLIKETGPRKPGMSDLIKEANGSWIHSQNRRIERWAEHFKGQFTWPAASAAIPTSVSNITLEVNTAPPSEQEVLREVRLLKRHKAAGPDRLSPSLFKDGGSTLISQLTKLFQSVWEHGKVPQEWCESVIIPVYKKGDRSSCENHGNQLGQRRLQTAHWDYSPTPVKRSRELHA